MCWWSLTFFLPFQKKRYMEEGKNKIFCTKVALYKEVLKKEKNDNNFVQKLFFFIWFEFTTTQANKLCGNREIPINVKAL